MSFCVKCGAKIDDGQAACPSCGAKADVNQVNNQAAKRKLDINSMSNLLISTKVGKGMKTFQTVCCVLEAIIGIALLCSIGFLKTVFEDMLDMGAAGVIFGIFFGFSFLISPVFAVIGNRSHCNVYENGVAGITGLSLSHPNTPMQSFCISYDEIINVTESGRTIFIYTKYCTYEILAMKNRAEAAQIIRSRMSGTV